MFRLRADGLLRWIMTVAAVTAGAVLVLIVAFLLAEAAGALRTVGPAGFLTHGNWRPAEGLYGLAPIVSGTLLVAGGALLLAIPLGIASAVFVHHYAPPLLAAPYRRVIELMAGVPSVVYGFWGLVTVVPLIGLVRPPGSSVLAGVLILTLMVLPMMALTAYAALAEVSYSYLDAAAALGLSRWGTVRSVILPAARTGIATGAVLSVGRAVGETMAVLMVTGNVVQVPDGVFEPVRVLTANIALEMGYALDEHRGALFVTGLLLLLVVVGAVVLAEALERREAHR